MLSQPEINDRLKQAEQEAKLYAKNTTAKYLKFDKGFWCGDYNQPDYGMCCFMHWRGLPIGGDGKRHPLYSFQQPIIDDLESGVKYLAIFKAPKLGISEIFLSYAVYKTITDPAWQNGQVAILVGTNEKDGQFMLERAKKMINGRISIDQGKYVNKNRFTLNTVVFMAMPAGHYDTIRQRPNMRMIIGDEIAFFVRRKEDQQGIRSAFEHYHTSGYTIVGLITTAGEAPQGFAFDIFKEANSIWKKHILHGSKGLELHPQSNTSIYDKTAFEDKRTKSPATFAREMDLKWGYEAGNVFKFEDIETAIQAYDLDGIVNVPCSMAMDPAFGTSEKNSKFAFIIAAMVEKKVRVYAFKLLSAATIDEALGLAKAWIDKYKPASIYIDGARPDIIKSAKRMVNERSDFENDKDHEDYWHVKPVYFGREGKEMLGNLQQLVSLNLLQVHPDFKQLIDEMHIAQVDDKGLLDKTQVSLDGIDALRMVCKSFYYGPQKVKQPHKLG